MPVMRPPLTLRYSRQLFTNPLKRAFIDELGHGLARETYAQRAFFPFGGEMEPLDRPWDQQPWSTANGQTAAHATSEFNAAHGRSGDSTDEGATS